jgi:trehalose 6-phosphate phosphatase
LFSKNAGAIADSTVEKYEQTIHLAGYLRGLNPTVIADQGKELKIHGPTEVLQQILDAEKIRIFLDYDGTLAEFAPTPDEISPHPELINLLESLKNNHRLNVAIISGRRLSHIRTLIPIPGILLAGTYGIEYLDPFGKKIDRLEFKVLRPKLEKLKPRWQELIQPHQDFYLEDKGWSLALHAKYVEGKTAGKILNQARLMIDQADFPSDVFRILGGHKFLEVAPRQANKGLTVRYLISRHPLEGSLPIYIGDDDKDEEAFEVILENAGVAIKVCPPTCDTIAQLRLDSPAAVRQFLASLL